MTAMTPDVSSASLLMTPYCAEYCCHGKRLRISFFSQAHSSDIFPHITLEALHAICKTRRELHLS